MAKIRIIQPTYDKSTNEQYGVNTILDLGATRNKAAVDSGQAVYVDADKLESTTAKGEKVSEKVDAPAPKVAGQKTKVVKGKTIETK